jgi:hypothetical protein
MFLNKLLDYFNGIVSDDILDNTINNELEIKVLLDPRIRIPKHIHVTENKQNNILDTIKTVKNIINNATQYGGISLSQTINFIKTHKSSMFVKQLVFVNGIQDKSQKKFYTKNLLIKPVFLVSKESRQPSYKLSINKEVDQTVDENEFDIVRFRLRYSILFHGDLKNWQLDLTLVKETKNQSVEQLKQIRNKLFNPDITTGNFMETADWSYSDRIEVELEYIGKNIQISDISKLDLLWEILYTKQRTYNDCVCQIAQILKPKSLDKFKSGYFGLKQLGSNPVELTQKSYSSEILTDIDNYVLTEKIDGIRSMLIIYPQKGECHVINKTYRYIDIHEYNPNNLNGLIILDTEEYIENGVKYYYVFDVIWCDKNISKYNFCSPSFGEMTDRLEYVEKIVAKYDFLRIKHFIHLNQLDYSQQINDFYELVQTLPYETDGFIFISKNGNYSNTMNFKWKPVEKSTVDFIARECPWFLLGINPYAIKNNKTLYLLFSGIRNDEYKKLGIPKIKNYEKLFKKIHYKDQYFPIQFSPSSDPYAYLFWSDNSKLDNSVVELTRKDNLWELYKIRDDRKIDMDRKTYYGNYFKYAEFIWMSYQNPLTIKNLCAPIQQEYFKVDNNEQYKYVRKFNNFVKDQLIIMYTQNYETQWVIDLAAGKGQDLFKYIDCKIQNILMIDNDLPALTEVINRKYGYIGNKSINTLSKIFIKQLNLTDPYKQNISALTESRFDIPLSGVQLVVCNFALHYLIPNKRKIQNFVGLLNGLLKPGGVFIFTAFDGQKVFDLLESNNGEWGYKEQKEDKLLYSIKKKYTGGFTGNDQQIDVLLPFSNNKYYPEYLIDIDNLTTELGKKKIELINEDSFNIYLNKFKKVKPHFHKEMSDADKTFAGLYSFYIFHKKNNSRRK